MQLHVPWNVLIADPINAGNTLPDPGAFAGVPDQARIVLPEIIRSLVSEISSKAQLNPARTVAFNITAENGWMNDQFGWLVQLSSQFYVYLVSRQDYSRGNNPTTAVAKEIAGHYTSLLITQYPELSAACGSNHKLMEAARKNSPLFYNLQSELAAMFGQNNQPPQGNGYQRVFPDQQQGYPQPVQQGYPVPVYQSPQYPQNYPPGYTMQPPPMPMNPIYQPAYAVPGYGQPAAFNTAAGQQPTNNQIWGGGTGNDAPATTGRSENEINNSRYRRTATPTPRQPDNAVSQPQYQQQYQAAPQPAPSKIAERPELQILYGTEMDRNRHQIVYFGTGFVTPEERRFKDIERANSVETPPNQPNADTAPALVQEKNGLVSESVETAITNGRRSHIDAMKKNGGHLAVYREFVTVENIAPSKVDIYDKLAGFGQAKTLFEVANFGMKCVKELETLEGEVRESYHAALVEIERRLTDILNDFLENDIRTTVVADSAFSDIPVIEEYLRTEYNNTLADLWVTFCNKTAEGLFAAVPREDLQLFMDSPDDAFYTFPVNYSFTFLELDSHALGYRVERVASIINAQTAPELHRMCQSIMAGKAAAGTPTVFDVIVTGDDRRYAVKENPLVVGTFIIRLL